MLTVHWKWEKTFGAFDSSSKVIYVHVSSQPIVVLLGARGRFNRCVCVCVLCVCVCVCLWGGRGWSGSVPSLFFCSHLFFGFCNHFEELGTALFEVELIINNAPLAYVYPNTIETCLTPSHLLFDKQYYIFITQHQL